MKRLSSGRVPLANLPALLNQNTQPTTPVRSKKSPHKPITPQDIMKSTSSSHVKRSEDKKKGLSQSSIVSDKSMVAPPPPPVLYCGSPRPSASTGLLTAHEVEHAWRSTTLDR